MGRERSQRSAGVDGRAAAARSIRAARSITCWTTARSWRPATRRRKHTTEFTVEVEAAEDHGGAAGAAERSEPAARRAGPVDLRHVRAHRVQGRGGAARPAGQDASNLKFAKATADVNPPERELEKAFDDRSGKRRVTGPIEFANDGNELTAWGIDIGPGRSNVPRKAVFVLDKPLEAAGGVRLTFKLVQNHGGWNSDDNQNNNLGRFRFSVTSAENAGRRSAAGRRARDLCKCRPASARPSKRPACSATGGRPCPSGRRRTGGSRRCGRAIRRARRSSCSSSATSRARRIGSSAAISSRRPKKCRRACRRSCNPLDEQRPADAAATRLDFARWLADRRSPTTARSIVNRIWQAYFGTGLVATAEDLGTQGDPPSHPELLDWLAVELMDHDWSLKHIHRLIVTSATYRQSSAVTPRAAGARSGQSAAGPRAAVPGRCGNRARHRARGQRAVESERSAGRACFRRRRSSCSSRRPATGRRRGTYDTGPDRYRRGAVHVPLPLGAVSGAAELSTRRSAKSPAPAASRSNTPLQALTTLNEPLFVECARALAHETGARGRHDAMPSGSRTRCGAACRASRKATS